MSPAFRINRGHFMALARWIISSGILFFYLKSCGAHPNLLDTFTITFMDMLVLFGCSLALRGLLIPRFLYQKKQLLFAVLVIVLMFAAANLILASQWLFYKIRGSSDPALVAQMLGNFFYQFFDIYLVITVGCLSIMVSKLLNDQWLAQTRYVELQKEKAQTELSFLKAQINPHFLFNSINSIYAHIDRSNADARQIVLKFSDMLRYQLYDCNSERIDVQKELAYLNNYVELQRLRKDNLDVTVETKGAMRGFDIAPLLLIPFIENAFKYASNHDDKANQLKVVLTREPQRFSFYCFNTKDRLVSREVLKDCGIGINNVKRRLELLYPGRYELHIQDNEPTFEVNLKIELS